jgi:FkbM family methyltransferase
VERYGCACLAVEPVPALFSRIEGGPRLKKLQLAIDGTGGEVALHLSANPQANSLFPEIAGAYDCRETLRVTATTLDELLARERLQHVDLLKLDVEGAELRVLAMASDEALRRIGQITVEFHDLLAGSDAAGPIRAIKRRLARAGFLCLVLSKAWGHHGDVLFLNLHHHPLGWRERLNLFLLLHVTLNVRGLIHILCGRIT